MPADFYPFNAAFLGTVATRIINEVKGVNRVVGLRRDEQAAGDDRVGVGRGKSPVIRQPKQISERGNPLTMLAIASNLGFRRFGSRK
jgi:hypothetical protein